MSESAPHDDGDLSGKVRRLIVTVQRNGFYVRVGTDRLPSFFETAFPDGDYVAADRDELAALVKRLMAEPPEGKAP